MFREPSLYRSQGPNSHPHLNVNVRLSQKLHGANDAATHGGKVQGSLAVHVVAVDVGAMLDETGNDAFRWHLHVKHLHQGQSVGSRLGK